MSTTLFAFNPSYSSLTSLLSSQQGQSISNTRALMLQPDLSFQTHSPKSSSVSFPSLEKNIFFVDVLVDWANVWQVSVRHGLWLLHAWFGGLMPLCCYLLSAFFLSIVVVCVEPRAVCPTVWKLSKERKWHTHKTTAKRLEQVSTIDVEPRNIEQKKSGKEIGGKWACAKGKKGREGWWSKWAACSGKAEAFCCLWTGNM